MEDSRTGGFKPLARRPAATAVSTGTGMAGPVRSGPTRSGPVRSLAILRLESKLRKRRDKNAEVASSSHCLHPLGRGTPRLAAHALTRGGPARSPGPTDPTAQRVS